MHKRAARRFLSGVSAFLHFLDELTSQWSLGSFSRTTFSFKRINITYGHFKRVERVKSQRSRFKILYVITSFSKKKKTGMSSDFACRFVSTTQTRIEKYLMFFFFKRKINYAWKKNEEVSRHGDIFAGYFFFILSWLLWNGDIKYRETMTLRVMYVCYNTRKSQRRKIR